MIRLIPLIVFSLILFTICSNAKANTSPVVYISAIIALVEGLPKNPVICYHEHRPDCNVIYSDNVEHLTFHPDVLTLSTVSDSAMILYWVEEGTVRFRFNKEHIKSSNLKISSKLRRLER